MKILKRIGLFAVAVLVAVGAVFVPRTAHKASADVVTSEYYFTASDMYHFDMYYTNNVSFSSVLPTLFSCNFTNKKYLNH